MKIWKIAYTLSFCVLSATVARALPSRELNVLNFPEIARSNDVDSILDDYPAYLKFVLEIGRKTDPLVARKLQHTYEALLKYFPKSAALFLKGLRFEMLQRLELSGRSSRSISTQTGEYRRFVSRYLKTWLYEADEHYFRARVASMVARTPAE